MSTANKNKIEARKKKVLEAKLKNPVASERDIAREVGAGNATIHRDLDSLKQDGALQENNTINAIRDADLEIVTLGQSIILDRFRTPEEIAKVSTRDVSAITKDSQVRSSFLKAEQGDGAKGDNVIQVINYG